MKEIISRRRLMLWLYSGGLRWIIAGITGAMLGVYALTISSLPENWLPLAILALLCPVAVMVIGHVRRLLLAVILLELPFQLDTYLFYREAAAELNAIGGLNVSITTLLLAILYILWLAELLASDDAPRLSLKTAVPLLSYVLLATASLAVARDVGLSLFEIALLWQTFFLFLYVANTTRTREEIRFIIIFLLLGLLMESIIIVGIRGVGHDITIANIKARVDDTGRIGGTIGSPNAAGSYLTLLLVPSLAFFTTKPDRGQKWLAAAAFALGGIALIFTLSRGGWAGFVLSMAVFFITAWYQGRIQLKVLIALAVFVAIVFVGLQGMILDRAVGDFGNRAAYSRIPLAQIALQMIGDHPIFGVGANNYAVILPQYVTPEFGREWISTVHNKYLLVWAETGFGALLAFIWFLLSTLRRGFEIAKRNDQFLSPLALGFTAAVAGNMLHMTVDLYHGRPQVQMLWLVAALVAAMTKIMRATGESRT